jgi:hypothetical protein
MKQKSADDFEMVKWHRIQKKRLDPERRVVVEMEDKEEG